MAHGVAGALLVETLRPAPINQQTLPETSLDLIGYEAPRGEIIEKDAGGATARAAGANATQLSQGAIRRVSVRTTPPPTSYAALQRPASARTETTLQTMQTLDSVDPSVSAASELDTDGEILDARDPDPFPLVDEIHIPGQQTLTAVTTAKIPLLQTVPTETHRPVFIGCTGRSGADPIKKNPRSLASASVPAGTFGLTQVRPIRCD